VVLFVVDCLRPGMLPARDSGAAGCASLRVTLFFVFSGASAELGVLYRVNLFSFLPSFQCALTSPHSQHRQLAMCNKSEGSCGGWLWKSYFVALNISTLDTSNEKTKFPVSTKSKTSHVRWPVAWCETNKKISPRLYTRFGDESCEAPS